VQADQQWRWTRQAEFPFTPNGPICRGFLDSPDGFGASLEIVDKATHIRFHRGLGYVPEDRRVVSGLTVHENLRLGLVAAPNRIREAEAIDRIAATFPRLKERLDQLGETLSGGEQQMLAIAGAVVPSPR
jgi:branched-chain amino acid transport system ATP-binding protein